MGKMMVCKKFSMFVVTAIFLSGAFFGMGCSSDVGVAEKNKQAMRAVSLDELSRDVEAQKMEAQVDEHGRLYDEVERPMEGEPIEGVPEQ